jgi:hypothetical protein
MGVITTDHGCLYEDGTLLNTIRADQVAKEHGFVYAEQMVEDLESKMFKLYKRKGLSEMRPYRKGESLIGISVSPEDNPETDMGMIARNPNNHADKWYVARKYFEENLEEVK